MTISFEVKGTKTLVGQFKSFAELESTAIGRAISRGAHRIEADAKRFAPVKTGRLRTSIHAEPTGPHSARVFVGVDYGIHQEFGWVTKNGRKIPGKFYLKRSVDKNRRIIEDEIAAAHEKGK